MRRNTSYGRIGCVIISHRVRLAVTPQLESLSPTNDAVGDVGLAILVNRTQT